MTRARLALLAAAVVAGCGEEKRAEPAATPSPPAGKVLAVDDGSYERVVRQTDGPVLVVFWAPWSGPAVIVRDYLDAVARERPELTVAHIDVDKSPKAASRHEIVSIPASMVLVDGKPRGRAVVGAKPQKEWERELGLDEVSPRSSG